MQRFVMKHAFFKLLVPIFIIMLALVGCDDGSSSDGDNDSDNPTNPSNPGTSDPGTGNLSGKVIGTIYGNALSGVTVTVGSQSAVTASNGTFQLNGVGEGNLAVVVSGSKVYRRTQMVNTAEGRAVVLDAIETGSNFNLRFYRELARGNHPKEGDLFQTHRWTSSTPPTFYINTNAASAIDGKIDQKTIDTVTRVLKEVVPIYTGGLYSNITVQTANFPSQMSFNDVPNNGFVISFDDTLRSQGAYGLTYTDPDFTSPFTNAISKVALYILDSEQFYKYGNPANISFEEIIAHESGHGFGFRHTSEPSLGGLPSVMVKTGEYGGTFSIYDELHMAIVYSRPAGSTDIDNDPGSTSAKQIPAEREVFIDDRATGDLDAETQRQLAELPGFALAREALQSQK